MTVTLHRDPFAAAPGPAVAALVFCGEDEEGAGGAGGGEGGGGGEEEMDHDGGGGGGKSKSKTAAVISLSHAGLAAPGDTIPGAGAESNADEGGLLRGHGTRAGGVDLVAAATATATTAAGGAAVAAGGGAPPPSSSTTTTSSSSRGLFATVAGQVSRVDRLVRVAPALPGARYSADVGDVVVGRVVEVSGKRWRVDLGGKHDAALALSAVSLPVSSGGGGGGGGLGDGDGGLGEEEDAAANNNPFSTSSSSPAVARRRGAEDEASMREILAEGDLLSAEVQAVHSSDGSLLLHARSSKYGRLGGAEAAPGCLVRLPASSVGRQRQQFNELASCGVSVIRGVNGWGWVSPLAGAGRRQQKQAAVAGGGGGGTAAAKAEEEQQKAAALLDGRRAVAVAAAALRALSSLGIAVTPRSIERAVAVAAAGNFAPSADLEEEYLLAVARAERAAR